jgi:hypothetical protein
MAAPTRIVVGLFALMGLISGILVIPLAFLWLPLVFVCEGALFAVGFAVACVSCRRWLPRVDVLQFSGAMLALTLGYPLAIGFGAALSLAAQWVIQRDGVMPGDAPLTMLGLMLLFGSLAAAMFVQMAVAMVMCEWRNGVFGMLVLAGLATAAVSFAIYLPFYASENELVMRYRELALFGVMAPLGNAAFGAVCGWEMARSETAENAMAAGAGVE